MNNWERFDEILLPNKEDYDRVQIWKTSQALIIGMQEEYLKSLIIKIWVIIMMYMFKATLYYLQMYLRCFKVDDKYLEKFIIFIAIYHSCQKE